MLPYHTPSRRVLPLPRLLLLLAVVVVLVLILQQGAASFLRPRRTAARARIAKVSKIVVRQLTRGVGGGEGGAAVYRRVLSSVLLDGQPIRSCITPIASIGTSAVTTIESLPRDGSHPLQRAWMELDVPQCGYCQAGQLMSASALLKATPNPTDEQIDTAMSGNVCRCGTYLRIKQAIKSAAGAGRKA